MLGILDADAFRAVVTHLRGMAVEEQDAGQRAKLQTAIQILREDSEPSHVDPLVEDPHAGPNVWHYWLTPLAAFLAGLVVGRFPFRKKRQSQAA